MHRDVVELIAGMAVGQGRTAVNWTDGAGVRRWSFDCRGDVALSDAQALRLLQAGRRKRFGGLNS